MPSISTGDQTTLRSYPQSLRRYISIAPRTSLFNCQVNGTPPRDATSNGLFRFNYDNASGVSGVTAIGMTIDIGTSLGDRSIGSVRMRNTLDGTRVAIEETAYSKVPIQNDYYASIIDEFLPAPKLPRLVGVKNNAGFVNSFTEYHDYATAYSNQNTNIQPQANITASSFTRRKPSPAGWVDEGQTYRTMTLSSSHSFAMKTGAGISSRLWDMKDGTYISGNNASVTPIVRFPVGYRIISLKVTDSAGTTHTQYFPIWVHDDTYPPITNFKVTSDTRDEGREMNFELFGEDDLFTETVIPKLATVCYWEDAEFDGEEPPVEYIDSFLGWTTDESTTIKLHDRSIMTLNVGGIAYWLSTFPGFGQKISHASTVNRWFKMQAITIDRMVHYILREYTTALSICNFYLSGDTTTVRSEEIKKSDIWNQCVDMAKGNYSTFTADALNGLWLRRHYSYLELTTRSTVAIIMNLNSQDWTDESGLRIDEQYPDKISIVSGAGSLVQNNKNKQIYSKAPGLVPAHSGSNEDAPYQRLPGAQNAAQVKLNQLTGHHYARVNNPRSEVNLSLVGNLDVFEKAWGEPVTVTWSEDNIRGLIVNTEEFIISKVSVTHSNERGQPAKKITLTLEQATIGSPGEPYTPPDSPSPPPATVSTNFPGINFPTYSPFEWYNTPPSVPKLTAFTYPLSNSESIYRLTDTADNRVEWSENIVVAGGKGICFTADPFSPMYLGSGTTVNGWYLTTTKFSRITDIFADTPSSSDTQSHPVTFEEEIVFYASQPIVASRITQNFVMAIGYRLVSGTYTPYICRTTDGVNWAYDNTTLPTFASLGTFEYYRIDISPHVAGLVYISGNGALYESTDYGLTFTDITADHPNLASNDFSRILHMPYAANPNSRRFYFADDGIVGVIVIGVEPDVTVNLVGPVDSGNKLFYYDMDTHTASPIIYPSNTSYYRIVEMASCDSDPTRLAVIMWPVSQDIDANWTGSTTIHTPYQYSVLITSRNAGKTWSKNPVVVEDADRIKIASSSPDFLYIYGAHKRLLPSGDLSITDPGEAYIAVSKNFGKDIVDGTRNLVDFTSPVTTRIHNIVGSM